MNTRVNWIEGAWPGRLAISPCPAGGEWLENQISSWARAGIGLVVSLLTLEDVAYLDLTEEEELCRAHSISFAAFPIEDLGVPSSREDARSLISSIERGLAEGRNVLVHCQGGIGRSGLITSCVLVHSGMEPGEAMRRASDARGISVPETNEQRQWVRSYAEAAGSGDQ